MIEHRKFCKKKKIIGRWAHCGSLWDFHKRKKYIHRDTYNSSGFRPPTRQNPPRRRRRGGGVSSVSVGFLLTRDERKGKREGPGMTRPRPRPTCTILCPSSASTIRGTYFHPLSPWPRRPSSPRPHVYTAPSSVVCIDRQQQKALNTDGTRSNTLYHFDRVTQQHQRHALL